MQEAMVYLLMDPAVGGNHRKAAVWSPTGQVTETAEAEGESSQLVEVKAI